MTEDKRPFAGVRMLEVGRVVASPFGGYLLGLLGADVIKIEEPCAQRVRLDFVRMSSLTLMLRWGLNFSIAQSRWPRSRRALPPPERPPETSCAPAGPSESNC